MKIKKQYLRHIIREEINKAIHEQVDPSMGLSSVFSPWAGLWDRATNAFIQGLRSGANSYGSYNTGALLSSATPANQNINFTVNIKFKPDASENDIRRINFTEIVQNTIREYLSQDLSSGIIENLNTLPEFSGQDQNVITTYANNLLQQIRNQIRVGRASSPRRDSNSILVALIFAASSSMLYLPQNWNSDLQTRIASAINSTLSDILIDNEPVTITWQTA